MKAQRGLRTCRTCPECLLMRRRYASEPPLPPPGQPGPSKPRFDSQEAIKELRSRTATASKALSDRSKVLRKDLEERLNNLGTHYARWSGYEHIETLKEEVEASEKALVEARAQAREAKAVYEAAIEARRLSQRESNDLLQRKSTWTEADVSRFTELVRKDHITETEAKDSRKALADCEDAVEKAFSALMSAILARYHEEQVWSDKIRSVSTYGSLAITAANVVVFLLAIVVVEPWRRNRLIEGVERRLHERETENATRSEESVSAIIDRLAVAEDKLDLALSRLTPSTTSTDTHTPQSPPSIPDLNAVLKDLMAEDEEDEAVVAQVDTRRRELLITGIGGLCVGALSVAAMLWR